MRILFAPKNAFILISYLLLSLIPLISLRFGKAGTDVARVLAVEVVCWFGLWAIFKRPAWLHIVLLPAFLALPAELYLNAYYGQGITAHHLGIMAETSPREAIEFLGRNVWILGGVVVSVAIWWWMIGRAVRCTRDLDMRGPLRAVLLVLLGLLTGVWIYGHAVGIKAQAPWAAFSVGHLDVDSAEKQSDAPEDTDGFLTDQPWTDLPKLPDWAAIPFEGNYFSHTWPFGLAFHVFEFWREQNYLAELKRSSSDFRFGARHSAAVDGPQIAVLVIGESSRYDRWSLNGYGRLTNPLLSGETNLISFSNVVTSVSATRLSVPVLLSRKPAKQSLQAGFSEKSLLSAFREAGFKTFWLSNQMTFGRFDTPVSVFANEAGVMRFLNLGGFVNHSNFDQILLAPLKAAMADRAEKKLIVLHTLGNHWNYTHRYPPEFDRWKPSLYGVTDPAYTDPKVKTALNNSYDNSILYTDWFLAQVISPLKESKQISSMLYISDHGEALYDGSCKLAFHGHNTQHEFHVPALVWYSDLYQAGFPEKVDRLRNNRAARLSTENIFHTLLDMNQIRYASERLEWSFASEGFKPHRRYVDSYGWSDYDDSRFEGDCREVIDKGKPLQQEK